VVAASPRTTSPIGKQLAELKGSDTVAGDGLGSSVAISGSTAIVGAYDHAKDAGRAYVFTMTGSSWHQVAELQGSDTVAGDEFGSSVAVSGTTAIVGAGDHAEHAGRAYVFTKTPGGWKQVAELKGSDTMAGDYFGWSVAISGATAVVGANNYGTVRGVYFGAFGRAYVFTKTSAGWKQVSKLSASSPVPFSDLGYSVAVSGTTAIVGAPYANNGLGLAYVFEA
jgi:hypothetical protein